MGAERSDLESLLMGLLADAFALKARGEQGRILERIVAGEEPLTVELSGGQVLVFLYGEQIAARSVLWFLGGLAEPGA